MADHRSKNVTSSGKQRHAELPAVVATFVFHPKAVLLLALGFQRSPLLAFVPVSPVPQQIRSCRQMHLECVRCGHAVDCEDQERGLAVLREPGNPGQGEYFLGMGEAPGRWEGRGLDELGLPVGGRVGERELEAAFGRAIHPHTGEQLGRAWRADGVTGYDLCLSAPKSVSALWALGREQVAAEVLAAHQAAVSAALEYVDGHASFSRVGADGHTQVPSGGLAAAVFDHRNSRAGDPQLHSHALVLNKVRCPDGGWRTIDGTELFRHKKAAGAVYQAALRAELTGRLAVAWTEVSRDGQAEIAGVPERLLRLWSKRTAQVLAEAGPVIARYEDTLGRPLTSAERTAVTKVAVLKTRPGKERVDIVALTERWRREAASAGWDRANLERAVEAARDLRAARWRGGTEPQRLLEGAVRAAGSRRAVFSRADLVVEIAARLPTAAIGASMTRERIEGWTDRALDTLEAIPLRTERDGPVRASDAGYASRTTLEAELRILAVADAGRSAGVGVVDQARPLAAGRRRGLDVSQEAALARITAGGDRISVLVAPAGTGKTTAVAVAVRAWQAAGHRVVLLAPSARAAAELQYATCSPADTVAKFLYDHQHQHQHSRSGWVPERARALMNPGDVIVIDEASMLNTADLDVLARGAEDGRAKLLLIGDPAQIGPVQAAGGMLAALADRLNAPSLEQVHRFEQPWEREASLQLRRGDPAVIDTYAAAGRIHDYPDDTTALAAMFDRYRQASVAGRSVLMLARTHRDVDELNELARAHATDIGAVRGPVLLDGPLPWQTGDRLRATRNNRAIHVGSDYLRNGDQFTVLGRAGDGLLVQRLTGQEHAVLPESYVRDHGAHGWASTIDAAQGATVDEGLLLARPGLDREHLYVGLTRGRHENHVYLAPAAADEIHHQPPAAASAGDGRQMLIDALQRSGAGSPAHPRLPGAAEWPPVVAARRSTDPSRAPVWSPHWVAAREPDRGLDRFQDYQHQHLRAARDTRRGRGR